MSESALNYVEIQQVLHKYCDGLDRLDVDAMTECFAPDCALSTIHGDFSGHEGIAAFMAILKRAAPDERRIHLVCNPIIEVSGAQATSRSVWIVLQQQDGELSLRSTGTYDDLFVRSDDEQWRLRLRVGRHLQRRDG